jgi:hypothetical protein
MMAGQSVVSGEESPDLGGLMDSDDEQHVEPPQAASALSKKGTLRLHEEEDSEGGLTGLDVQTAELTELDPVVDDGITVIPDSQPADPSGHHHTEHTADHPDEIVSQELR